MVGCTPDEGGGGFAVATRTVALTAEKGGVGKTTSTLALASELGSLGRKVLVVDLDPQCDTTTTLLRGTEPERSLWDVWALPPKRRSGALTAPAVQVEGWDQVFVVPGSPHLRDAELAGQLGGPTVLAELAEASSDGFDVVLIDCPRSGSELAVNALSFAQWALIIVNPSLYGEHGVRATIATVQRARAQLNRSLAVAGIVLTSVDRRIARVRERTEELLDLYGPQVWEPAIPYSAEILELAETGLPLHRISTRKDSPGRRAREAYRTHAERVLKLRRRTT